MRSNSKWGVWGWAGVLLALALLLMVATKGLSPPEGYVLGGLDVHALFFPWLSALHDAASQGRVLLWDPSQFAGYPFLANPQVAFFYPLTWLSLTVPPQIGISLYVLVHLWISGTGVLFMVRTLSHTDLGAGLAAVAYMLSGFMATRLYAGHIGLIATYSWLPWIILAMYWSVQRGDLWAALIAGLPWGLAVLAGHTSSLLYIGLIWAGFVVCLAVRFRTESLAVSIRWNVLRQAFLAGVVGLALSAVQLGALYQLSRLSVRSAIPDEDFLRVFSMQGSQFFTLLMPDFFGHPYKGGFWNSANFDEFIYYVGVLPILASLFAFRQPRWLTWYCVALISFGLLYSLGPHGFLHGILVENIPIFLIERVPARGAVLYTLSMTILFGEGIAIAERLDRTNYRSYLWMLGIGIVALTGLALGAIQFILRTRSDALNRLGTMQQAAETAVILLLIGGALLGAFTIFSRRTSSRVVFSAALGAFVITDLMLFGYTLAKTMQLASAATIWIDAKQIIGETEYRVLPWGVSIFEQNGASQVGLNSVFAYNTLEIQAHNRLTSSVRDPRSAAYDILSVAYVIAGGPLDEYTQGEHALTLVGTTGSAWIYERVNALNIARLVYDVEIIASNDQAVARVHEADFNPALTAILPAEPPCEVGSPDGNGTATITLHQPEQWTIQTDSESPALLLLSETAYPGWRVTVDGEPARPLTAYTTIRAVCVPAGLHEVVWTYQPRIFWLGGAISVAALAFITVAVIALHNASGQRAPEGETT